MRWQAEGKRSFAVLSAIAAALFWVVTAGSAPGDPKKNLQPADQARATAGLLHRADLPDGRWQVKPTDFSQSNPACLVQHYSLAALTVTGEAGFTYNLSNGPSLIESDAHVFVSDRQAARAFAIVTMAGLARCFGSAFASEISKGAPGVSARVLSVHTLRLAAMPGAVAHGSRIFLRLRSKTGDNLVEIVLVNVHHSRTVGSLSLVKIGGARLWLKTHGIFWSNSLIASLARTTATRMR